MRVSLLNLNLVAGDAIGACIIDQARFFQRRGDDVRIYVLHPPHGVAEDIARLARIVELRDLIDGSQEHFCLSDLYIYHYPGRHSLMESMRGIDRGAVIFYYHNVTPPELWGSEDARELLVQGQEGRALVHYADLCIADSPFNKQDLVDQVGYDADRVIVLPLPVSLARFSPGEADPELIDRYGLAGQHVLLFVGRMAGNKRIDLLVDALAQVRAHVPNVKLMLVGDDRGTPAYREMVSAAQARARVLGVGGDVIWTGPVDDQLPYYRLADVYVSASLHEGFGLPLLEAMACGVPVVASRAGAMPWVLGEGGLLAEPGDAASLAGQVVRVLADDELRRGQVERGLARVAEFSVERYEAGLAEIVDKAVTYTLPDIPLEPAAAPEPRAAARDRLRLDILAEELEAQADVMLRGYTVRSGLPLVGCVVAWVRRNLTSHLREPYLDPTLERQVALNRRAAAWARQASAALTASAQHQAMLEARIKLLEAQVEALTQHERERRS